MMNDTVGIDDAGHRVSCHARKARILDLTFAVGRLQRRRRCFRAKRPDRKPPKRLERRKTTCQSGPSACERSGPLVTLGAMR
jgi:hypothetical protein